MNTDRRSWHLKVERADRHLEEIKSAMADYASKQPFRAVRARQPKDQRHIWLYRLEMTEEPDPMIPVIIGECLYDLRSALDHLAVAMVPRNRRSSAAFPIEWTDPWEKDATGLGADYVHEVVDHAEEYVEGKIHINGRGELLVPAQARPERHLHLHPRRAIPPVPLPG